MFLLGVYFRDCAITTWNNLHQVNLKEGFMGNEHVVEKNVSALRTFLVETIIGVLIFLIIAFYFKSCFLYFYNRLSF